MRIVDIQGRALQLENSFLETGMFGDGSDGSPNFNGTNTFSFASKSGNDYTLTRSIFCVDMTVGSTVTVKTAGFKVFCTGTLTNNGTISSAGNFGAGAGGGAALASVELGGGGTGGTGGTGSTGSGGAGSAGGTVAVSMGAAGGNAGAGGVGTGGAGGGPGASGSVSSTRPFRALSHHLLSGVNLIVGGAGGAGGGAGAGNGSTSGGAGGGGGSGGGVLMIFAAVLILAARKRE